MTTGHREKLPVDQWTRLAGAALTARDDLRMLASELTAAMEAGSIPRALIIRARDAAARHADGLRLALKHPSAPPSPRKFNRDLPCWGVQPNDGTATQ